MNPLTGVLAEAWGLYRRFAAHFLTIAFVLYFLTAVIVTILVQTAGVTGYFVASVIEFAATFLVQAAMIKAVQDVRDGRADLSMDATVSAAVRYLLPVIDASILAGIGIGIVLVFLIWVAFDIALGLALVAVPGALRSFLSTVIGGTLLAPFYALVLTLVYYRLSE